MTRPRRAALGGGLDTGQEQGSAPGDQLAEPGPGGPLRGVGEAVGVPLEGGPDLEVQGVQLLGGEPARVLRARGRIGPVELAVVDQLGAGLVVAGDLALQHHLLQRAPGPALARGGVDVVPRQAHLAHAPGTLASDAAAGLLDEGVLGELAQVPGAVGRGLVEPVGELGGRERAVDGEQLHDPEPHRMGEGLQLSRVAQSAVRRSRRSRVSLSSACRRLLRARAALRPSPGLSLASCRHGALPSWST